MPQFSYRARRRSGEVVEGLLDVADRSAALVQIERLGLFPVSVNAPKGAAAVTNPSGAPREEASLGGLLPPTLRAAMTRKRKPKMQEMATFTQQLANLLQSGMPLTLALNSMTHLESKGIPSSVSKQLKQEVMEGRSLSNAMAGQPRIFTPLYINMVRAGESSGQLVDVLRRLSDHLQRFAEVQAKFKSAMIYPAAVCCVGVVIIGFFMFFMMPKFTEIFNGFNIQLPLPTRVLMGASKLALNIWFLGVAFIVIVTSVAVFLRFRASEVGKRKIDELKMKLPMFGKVVKLNLFGQFARVLSTLLRNGVPVLDALKITEQVIPNRIVADAIANARVAVTDGKTLAQPLAQSKVFPQLMVDLVKIGEETGDVPGALTNLAETYEGELQIALRVMINLIEPALIIVMAVGVGALLLSILLPMFNLISNISAGAGGK